MIDYVAASRRRTAKCPHDALWRIILDEGTGAAIRRRPDPFEHRR